MADLEEQFQKAAKDVGNLKVRPGDQELLEIYALFKQATVGDCNQPKPAMYQLKEKAKHDFWTRKKGMSQEEAKRAYVTKVNSLIEAHGLKD